MKKKIVLLVTNQINKRTQNSNHKENRLGFATKVPALLKLCQSDMDQVRRERQDFLAAVNVKIKTMNNSYSNYLHKRRAQHLHGFASFRPSDTSRATLILKSHFGHV